MEGNLGQKGKKEDRLIVRANKNEIAFKKEVLSLPGCLFALLLQ